MKHFLSVTALLLLAFCLTGCGGRRGGITEPRSEPSVEPTVYRIVAELSPREHILSVESEIEYSVPIDDLSAVKFRIYPNAYSQGREVVTEDKRDAAYPNGRVTYGGVDILSVSSDLPVTDYDLGQDDVLTVRLGETLRKGARVCFRIAERITLANVRHRLGYYGDYYYLSNFYPEVCPFSGGKYLTYEYTPYGDPFLMENASFSLDLTLPVGYGTACSAPEIRRERQGTVERIIYASSATREIALVTSPALRAVTADLHGVTVAYHYADGSDREKMLAFLLDAMAYYEERFGAYPYPAYSVVSAPFFESGVEHPGMSLISSDLSLAHKKKTASHETAHQWWFGKVGNDEYLSPWLDEGLAEYSVACYYRARGYDAVAREMIRDAEDAYSIRLALKGSEGVRFDLPLPMLSDGYYDRVYAGGLLLFHALSERFGEDRFHAALRDFSDSYAGKIASPDTLIRSLTHSLGEDPSALFRVWLTGSVPLQ